MNKIYLSTGAFIGRVNGRNWHLLTENHELFDCDGFEFMIFESFVEILDEIIKEYTSEGINIPAVHALKTIGDKMSDKNGFESAKDGVKISCEAAVRLGAEKLIVHCWGKPDSDADFPMLCDRIGEIWEIAKGYGLDLLPENSFCVYGSPLEHFKALKRMYPDIGFIMDTRCAEFHGETEGFGQSGLLSSGIRHIHVNDYLGGYKDWDAMYPIPQPRKGRIDWDKFFGYVRSAPYGGSFTLEAPSMLENGVDADTLNDSMSFIRKSLQKR